LFTNSTIQSIKDANPSEIIGHFIKLKKEGVNYKAPCPFHDEKSASFVVNDVKGIYKCFGCGVSGDAIKFVMQYEHKDFIGAVEMIGPIAGITICYDEAYNSEESKKIQSEKEILYSCVDTTVDIYTKQLFSLPNNHSVRAYLSDRKLIDSDLIQWRIGWVNDWRIATPILIVKELFAAGEKSGVIKRSTTTDSNYDFFHHRLTFPIQDSLSRTVSIGGRIVPGSDFDYGNSPKYINGPETSIYNKSKTLYGIHFAKKQIKSTGFAILVEGYLDVISLHKAGSNNSVGTCGTALTDFQAKELKLYTNHVLVMRDGDKPGQNAAEKDVRTLLKSGFRIDVCTLPSKHDPDSFVNSLSSYDNALPYQLPKIQDSIFWYASLLFTDDVIADTFKNSDAQKSMIELLSIIPDELYRKNCFNEISSLYKWKSVKKELETKLISLVSSANSIKLPSKNWQPIDNINILEENEEEEIDESRRPKWVSGSDLAHWKRHGYFISDRSIGKNKKIGYYTLTVRSGDDGSSYTSNEITNFLVTPIMHIPKGDDSRHIIEINNGYVTAVKEIQSASIPNREQFQGKCVQEGSFAIFGSSLQWLRIASDLLHKFPRCIELEELGFHPYGIFAYSDYVFDPKSGKLPIDKYGIIEHENQKYLLPQQSEAYLQMLGTSGDPFENDRVLSYRESPVSFSDWCKKVSIVYGDKGITAIAFCIFTLFRDAITKVTGFSPHLYMFGPPQSGKSVLAKTIYSLFYLDRSFFIAYEGTVPAFYTYMSRFINCPACINEIDSNTDPDRIQAFKGAFDLEGREKMNISKSGNKRSTTIQRINSSLILVGQHILTTDDNAMPSRCIIEDFLPNDNRTEEQIINFDELAQLGKQGITSLLTDLLKMRTAFDTTFRDVYLKQLSEFMARATKDRKQINQRIAMNYTVMLSSYKIASGFYKLPDSVEKFTDYCYSKIVKWSGFIASSDSLSDFWRFINSMADSRLIEDGWDYIIDTQTQLEVRSGEVKKWDMPRRILFIRINNVHKVYQKEYRGRYSKDGISLENLLHYMNTKNYYLGAVKQKQFKRFINHTEQLSTMDSPYSSKKADTTVTSAYAFLYDTIEEQVEGFHISTAGTRNKEPEVKTEDTKAVQSEIFEEKVNEWRPVMEH
jgi:DNA primase